MTEPVDTDPNDPDRTYPDRTDPDRTDPDLVRRLVIANGYPARSVRRLGAGLDHTVFLVDGLVVRFASEPDPDRVEREARLLEVVADVAPLPVPQPVFTVPELGCLAYRSLPGTPLLEQPPHLVQAETLGTVLGQFLVALQSIPLERLTGLVEPDGEPLDAWLAEAADAYCALAERLPAAVRPAVDAFVHAAPPDDPGILMFSHNDLGIEHVLADGSTVTGVIDWSDAAFVDPSHDLGRLMRDLGPVALDAALTAYPGDDPGLRERAVCFARCGVIEDLGYGLQTGRDRYVRKSLDALAWLFEA